MLKKTFAILRIVVPIALIVWLWRRVQTQNPEMYQTLWTSDKNWPLLISSIVLVFVAITISFMRWHLLLTAIGIPIRLFATLRLGFLGFLMSFVAPGQAGGDLFKAVFVAREQKENRAAAVATILLDRICGLYGLLVMATLGLLVTGISHVSKEIEVVAKSTYLCTAIATIGIIFILLPGMSESWLAKKIMSVPKLGRLVEKVFAAINLYKERKSVLVNIALLSLTVHFLLAFAVYLGALSLYSDIPTVGEHLVMSPLAGVAGALPITPGGLGSYELAMQTLYDQFSKPENQDRGIVLGLMYRFSTVIVAGIGLCFYWTNKREINDAMHEASDEETSVEPTMDAVKTEEEPSHVTSMV